jgi:hypothetical protein
MEPLISVEDYLAALKENRLLGLKCKACGFITTPPRLSCRRCSGQDHEVVQLSGKGRIATFTSVHIGVQSRHGKTPYLVVLVEMDEGPWIMGNLHGTDPAAASLDLIGKRVTMDNIKFGGETDVPEGITPQFVLT